MREQLREALRDRQVALVLGQCRQCLDESAVGLDHRQDNSADTEEHDNALDKIIYHRCHVTAQHDIDAGQSRHNDNTGRIRNIERHTEQSGQSVVDRRGIGNQEDK